ncbi:MAG: DM13 domain-containing protein [Chloroflexi bacterium]|nr:DM13 domain-containing protein [Chloroflexota bacterium]
MNTQRWIAVGILILLIACVATSNLWLAPFIDDDEGEEAATTEEAGVADTGPTATPNPFGTPTPTPDPVYEFLRSLMDPAAVAIGDEPAPILAGSFTVIDEQHRGDGFVDIFKLGEADRYVLFLEDDFSVSAGPDLILLLSANPEPRTATEALQPQHLNLGPLQATSGPQFYQIPEGNDPNEYDSVVIYSESFRIVYTSAELQEVRGGTR